MMWAAALVGFFTVALVGRGAPAKRYLIIVLATVAASFAIVIAANTLGIATAGMTLNAALAWGLVVYFVLTGRARRGRWREAALDPLVLQVPFAGRWRVAAGGPWARSNHHLVVSDQRFA